MIWFHAPACICSQCDPEEFARVFKRHPDTHKEGCICSDCCDARYNANRDQDAVRKEYIHALPETMGDHRDFDIATNIKLADDVNHPAHYTQGGIECIDAIKAALTPEEFRGFCKGNALKYVWRELHKGGAESLAKAGWYLDRIKPC